MKSSTLRRSHVVTRPSAQKMARRSSRGRDSSGALPPFARRRGRGRRAARRARSRPPARAEHDRRPRAVADDHRDVADEVERPQRDRAVARPHGDEPRARAGARRPLGGRCVAAACERADASQSPARANACASPARRASRPSLRRQSQSRPRRPAADREQPRRERLEHVGPPAPSRARPRRVAARARARADERRAVLAHDDEPRGRRPRRGRRLRRQLPSHRSTRCRSAGDSPTHVMAAAGRARGGGGPALGERGRGRAQQRLAALDVPHGHEPGFGDATHGCRVHLDELDLAPSERDVVVVAAVQQQARRNDRRTPWRREAQHRAAANANLRAKAVRSTSAPALPSPRGAAGGGSIAS